MPARHLPRLDTAPLAQQAREAILESILGHRFEGGRLPPEHLLAVQLGVSRTTVRAALQSLERDGFITRRRGIGTVVNTRVAPYRLGLHRLVGFSTLLAELGHVPAVSITVEVTTRPRKEWWQPLEVTARTETCVLTKLFLADGSPAISIVDVIPLQALKRRPSAGEAIPDSIFRFFEEYGAETIHHAVAELLPRNASPSVAERLHLVPGAAYLHLRETHYTRRNVPVGLTYIDVNDHYVRFDLVRRGPG